MSEKIDQAPDKVDAFTELVNETAQYVSTNKVDIKARLALERKIKKFQEGNTSDWLLNYVLMVHKACQTKERP